MGDEVAQHHVAAAGGNTLTSSSPLMVALVGLIVAQLLKVATHYYTDRRLDWRRCISSGGMPSSHSSTVVGVAVSVGLHEGFASHVFAVAAVVAVVVMYDAMGVRLQAGKHAEVINSILVELPPEHEVKRDPLKTLLGHTPAQVCAGATLGAFVAYTTYAHAAMLQTL